MRTRRILSAWLLCLSLCFACHGPGARSGSSATPKALEEADASVPADSGAVAEPAIRFISKGSILPSRGGMRLLFGAVSYAAAEVRVKKIYSHNILQFLQLDSYDVRYELYKVAEVVADTTLVLGAEDAAHIRQYRTYGLELDELVKPDPGALYHVEIRGREPLEEEDFWDSDYTFGNGATYEERSVDLLASDLSLVAKKGDEGLEVYAYNILTGRPMSGVRVKLFSFTQCELAQGRTDGQGHVSFPALQDGRFVTATADRHFAYLDLKNEKALSTSSFDVSGTMHEGGIKAYVFGERGVWRPGDTLHVSVITMYEGTPLPAGHPVTARLLNPAGQQVQELSARTDASNLYHFPFVTAEDAPTGNWRVDVSIGGRTFSKSLRVETIKPNKLDIALRFAGPYLTPDTGCEGDVSVRWLYGAPGSGLKMNLSLELAPARTAFRGWADYDFCDDARVFESQRFYYGDAVTDEQGHLRINTGLELQTASIPGLLTAGFTMQAFEPGGDFSTSYASYILSPFSAYVGLRTRMDEDEWGDAFLQAGKPHLFDVASVDADGKGVSVRELSAEIYHVDWDWWWNASEAMACYMASENKECVFSKTLATAGGKGSFSYDWADAPDGLYYIRVADVQGGHATSMLCRVGREAASDAAENSTQLNMLVDKGKYRVGETARVTIPSATGASALVSVEKGGRILRTWRVECKGGSTEIRIPVTRDMLPNAYAVVSLIQPHGNVSNDAPIRLYGIRNIPVEDPSSRLHPVLDVPAETRPESALELRVREASGQAMHYVVALVDEGLLSLTGFKTPDAWDAFYAKEALRVRTWDRYDEIIGAYGGRIEQMFAVGGDEEGTGPLKRKGADRFPPVVSYLGPFRLAAGKSATHRVTLPQYVGSLRAMVVATDGRAQGSAAASVSVTQPLMVQATLPRTLGPGETIRVPVTLMALKDGVGDVEVRMETAGPLSVSGSQTQRVRMQEAGQEVAYFDLQTAEDRTGTARVTVTARCRGGKSVSRVELALLHANPETTRSRTFLLAAGERREEAATLFGVAGTHAVSVELSSIPAIQLDRRLGYLMSYPYGCLEQTVSAVFPQLYLPAMTECDAAALTRISRAVTAGIGRLQRFRLADGALACWPGVQEASVFGSAYALHFLLEAEGKGYAVPADLKSGLVQALSRAAGRSKEADFARCYALYALAAAGKPERGTMNLLRDKHASLGCSAVWMLAAAYAADGKKKVALSLTEGLPYWEPGKPGADASYGSEDRNLAVAMRVCVQTLQQERAFDLARRLAASLQDASHYMSTQATAWALFAMADYARAYAGGGVKASVETAGGKYAFSSAKTLVRQDVPVLEKAETQCPLCVVNKGDTPLYAVVSVSGVPAVGTEVAHASGLSVSVRYEDMAGAPVRVASLAGGSRFRAVVTVSNTGSADVQDLALSQRFPSGWEIRNERLYAADYAYPAGVRYQDFRDDRVYSFFDLRAGQSVTLQTELTATYPGRFYLPAVSCEAMYDDRISALVPGCWVEVK
ncbi:MAG: alpha-2-macroglobulin [Bacteroidales bacterium]|nr:alpha-2-macroglobulin [Bacteroidales bacterium]